MKPALYGFPTTVALLMTIPHVVTIKGKGNRRMVHLSGDLQSKNCLYSLKKTFTDLCRPDMNTLANREDPNEMPHIAHEIMLLFTLA